MDDNVKDFYSLSHEGTTVEFESMFCPYVGLTEKHSMKCPLENVLDFYVLSRTYIYERTRNSRAFRPRTLSKRHFGVIPNQSKIMRVNK